MLAPRQVKAIYTIALEAEGLLETVEARMMVDPNADELGSATSPPTNTKDEEHRSAEARRGGMRKARTDRIAYRPNNTTTRT